MIKIYIENKLLFLIDRLNGEIESYVHQPDTFFLNVVNDVTIESLIHNLQPANIHRGIILHENLSELMALLKSSYHVIEAAGGLVYTPDHKLLLIFRRGKWDLPKGKLDAGETLVECALREIKEETGATALHIHQPLQVTYHTYFERGQNILKQSHWYLILTENTSDLKPQQEEDIEKCEWVSIENLSTHRKNMHASIQDVLDAGLNILQPKVKQNDH